MFLHTSASRVLAGKDLHTWLGQRARQPACEDWAGTDLHMGLGRRARQPACEGFYVKRHVGWCENGSNDRSD